MNDLFHDLEFDIVLRQMSAYASSPVVASAILDMTPEDNITAAKKLLTQTNDALRILSNGRPDLFFDDISVIVEKARVGAGLLPSDLLSVSRSISVLKSLKSRIEEDAECDSLKDIVCFARPCEQLKQQIDSAVENETELKDSASEKLYTLRRAIKHANAKLREKVNGFTKRGETSKYLQDNIVTLRDGRYVVPVRSEYRSAVKGLIHDVSATGATVFIEPFAIVEANNELKTLRTEEQNEVERILSELGKAVYANYEELTVGQQVLTECGIIFAKADYAKKLNAFLPILNDSGKISLLGARHPLIATDKVVPVDISMCGKKVLLISGPNTGGKTVALKIVGLFSLMAACGMFLPACDGSEICIFRNIYCDIGDSQSIAQSLSTFSAHIKNISEILLNIDDGALILLDEVGDGTDPDEGAALAVGIIKNIIEKNSVAVVTTHFNSVKEFAVSNENIAVACMQFDMESFSPTYKLLSGATGSSYALEIAERLGLAPTIIADARAELSEEKVRFDRVLRDAEKLRNEALRDKEIAEQAVIKSSNDAALAEKYKAEYQKKLEEIEEKALSLIRKRADEYSQEAEELIDEIKQQLKQADESALFAARKIAKKLSDSTPSQTKKPTKSRIPASESELTDGVDVYVSGLDKEGVIVGNPRGNKAVVAIGQIKTELPISSLSVIKKTSVSRRKEQDTVVREPINSEIILLGKTVSEAIEIIDRTLSDIPSKSTLRIVHGKGTGALGKGIQNYLNKHPRIKQYRYGRYGEGDLGVTIAEVK